MFNKTIKMDGKFFFVFARVGFSSMKICINNFILLLFLCRTVTENITWKKISYKIKNNLI